MRNLSHEALEESEQGHRSAYTLRDLFSAIGRHWFLVLLTTAIGGGAGYWLARNIPDSYSAEVTLISDAERSGIIETGGTTPLTIVDPSATTTVVETVSSPVVIARALESLSPDVLEQLTRTAQLGPEFANATPDERAAALRRFVARNLEVSNSGRSYVIGVEYGSTDPALAAEIANAVANAYIGYRTQLKQGVYAGILGDLDAELHSLKSELQAADREAQAMREQARLVAKRFEALTGRQQEAAIDESAGLFARQREAEREADATAAVYERLLLNQRDIRSRLEGPEANVQLFSAAVVPTRPSGFNAKPVVLLIGVMAGFLLGTSLAVMLSSGTSRRGYSA